MRKQRTENEREISKNSNIIATQRGNVVVSMRTSVQCVYGGNNSSYNNNTTTTMTRKQ